MIGRLLDRLARCVVCDDPAPGATLCAPCRDSLPCVRWPCPRCALPRRSAHAPCGSCLINTPDWDDAASAFAYRFPVDYLLKRAKFRGRLAELDALAHAAATHFASRPRPHAELLLPVPLHWRRQWRRGFNQAEALARPVADALDVPVNITALRRVRATREQSHLHTDDRAQNLRQAFVCDATVSGARVLIFDDVMTTGATLGAVTRAVQRAGANHVRVLTTARAF